MDNFCLPYFMAQSAQRREGVVWNSDYSPDNGYTEPERREASQHLQAELLHVLLQEINPNSVANKRKRKAICEKLQKWGKGRRDDLSNQTRRAEFPSGPEKCSGAVGPD